MNKPASSSSNRSIPESSLRRLPLYHRLLETLRDAGRSSVSCPEIGAELKLDPTQVRKDFEAAGIAGRPKIGYQIAQVLLEIEQFLGWDNTQDAILVGAGSLGTALLGYTRFERFGLTITAAFDASPEKIGTYVHNKQVHPLGYLPDFARQHHIRIGIITVPSDSAQQVADLMLNGGIRAIWNFAPIRLQLPPGVIVHNEDLYCSLASLSKRLAEAMKPAATPEAPPAVPAETPQ